MLITDYIDPEDILEIQYWGQEFIIIDKTDVDNLFEIYFPNNELWLEYHNRFVKPTGFKYRYIHDFSRYEHYVLTSTDCVHDKELSIDYLYEHNLTCILNFEFNKNITIGVDTLSDIHDAVISGSTRFEPNGKTIGFIACRSDDDLMKFRLIIGNKHITHTKHFMLT